MAKTQNMYFIVESEEEVDGILYNVYGVGCHTLGIEPVYNLSTKKEKVEELINMLNRSELDPIQLYEVCEDSLL